MARRWALVCVGASLACTGASSTHPVDGTVGAEGGSIAADGLTVDVPPGALASPTLITISPLGYLPAPSGRRAVSRSYRLEPEGLMFAVPATLKMSVDSSKLPNGRTLRDVSIYSTAAGASVFEALDTTPAGSGVQAATKHFSTVVALAPEDGDGGADDAGGVDEAEAATDLPDDAVDEELMDAMDADDASVVDEAEEGASDAPDDAGDTEVVEDGPDDIDASAPDVDSPEMVDAPIPCEVAQTAAGAFHTCARKTDGTLWCWGLNSFGELGDGTMTRRLTPVQVTALGASVDSVRAGFEHTCARKTDGTLWCWGDNMYGQIGDGTKTKRLAPVQVTALGTEVADVQTGTDHTCARKTDGTLWCWGSNAFGQLGDGTKTEALAPVQVTVLGAEVADVTLKVWYACARKTDGTLWCWGDGSLGLGTMASGPTPKKVMFFGSSVADARVGAHHACVLKTDGTFWCWGYNMFGQVGDGTMTDRETPVQLTALGTSAADFRLGWHHGCVRKKDGRVWCWGMNEYGQVGDGTKTIPPGPTEVTALADVAEVDAGDIHSCARKTDGTLWCWGYGYEGQLGDGTIENRSVPTPVMICPP